MNLSCLFLCIKFNSKSHKLPMSSALQEGERGEGEGGIDYLVFIAPVSAEISLLYYRASPGIVIAN